jgi:5-methylcytosine-specific restriction protein A
MPERPANPCTTPGCPSRALVGRCAACRARLARTGPATAGPYQDPRWRQLRIDYLIRHPRCALCGRLAQTPDHYPLSRKVLVCLGVADPDADEYLRPLCHRCHSRETAVHQPGGWHRDRSR